MQFPQNVAIEFRLDRRSGVPVYRQLVDQVQQALDLGILRRGDQLPTLSEVVGQLAINPNTVHRAYQELEREGVTQARQGVGTFVVGSRSTLSPTRRKLLERQLRRWVRGAREAGLDDGAMRALLSKALS
jgi:GntR family transcriptional regulator